MEFSSRMSNDQRKPPKQMTLLIPTGVKWYQQKFLILKKIPKSQNDENQEKLSSKDIENLRQEAIKWLKIDHYNYEQQQKYQKNSKNEKDYDWIKTILSNGTVQDKLAAYTILIQDSTVHNLRSLEQLIRFINNKGKRECIMAIDTLQDLFIGNLLIPEKKLQTFSDSLNSIDTVFLLNYNDNNLERKKILIISYVEDQIRELYQRFLQQLIQCTHDTLDKLKIKSINSMYELFINSPEQEKYLLKNLINKLGDPQQRVASMVIKLLIKILQQYSTMKMILIKEIESLLFRPNISKRTEHYCLCFMNEIIYNKNTDHEIANHVINIYFIIFTKYIKLGEINNRLMSLLLTGITRSFPYSKLEESVIEKYLNTFYKLIYYVNNNTSIQIYALIFHMIIFLENGQHSLHDRYYSSLYRFLLRSSLSLPSLDQCSKLNLLLNTLYRSMKYDQSIQRVRAFIKRLLQICLQSSTSFVISILILINSLLKCKDGFKTIDIWPVMNNKPVNNYNNHVEDDDDEDESINNNDGKQIKSWVFVDLKNGDRTINGNHEKDNNDEKYRFDCRNPLYANALNETCWELLTLMMHFHPTIKLYAKNIVSNILFDDYDGDPLDDFSLKHFLDRFSFKNPKQIDYNNENGKFFCRKKKFTDKSDNDHQINLNINANDYVEQNEDQIPIDERFIYNYLKQKKLMNSKSTKNNDDDDEDDIESVTSLEFNDLLDNYEQYVGDDGEFDYAKDLKMSSKKSKKNNRKFEDEDADFDEEFDDEDLDLDDIDDDLEGDEDDDDDEDVNEHGVDDGDDDSEEQNEIDDNFEPKSVRKALSKHRPRNRAPFQGKQGFSSITNDIFASAEQFDYLLDQNDDDDHSDYEDVNFGNDDDNDLSSLNRSKTNQNKRKKYRPNLGRPKRNRKLKI